VSLVHDLVRASIVGCRKGALLGIAQGWRAARSRPWQVLAAFWPRGAGALLAVLLALLVTRAVGVGSTWGLAASVIAWQLAALSLVVLRASWLSRALELVRET
jgi:hypothetical protein